MFPFLNSEPGDLVFFHRFPAHGSDFEEAVISSSTLNANIYHVALIVEPNIYTIVHATTSQGVVEQPLVDAIKASSMCAIAFLTFFENRFFTLLVSKSQLFRP